MNRRGIHESEGRANRGRLMKLVAAGVAALGVMFAPGVALAGSSTCQQYNPQTCNVVPPTATPTQTTAPTPPVGGSTPPASSTPPTPTTPQPATPTVTKTAAGPTAPTTVAVSVSPTSSTANAAVTGSTLPFTGLDLGLVVAGGLVLMGGGLLVRRASRRPD
jgi:hypothetical protein